MQVEPQATAQAQPPVTITTPAGGGLSLDPGRQVVARVVQVSYDGAAIISLGGSNISVQSSASAQFKPGDTLSLTVGSTQNGRVNLTLNQPQAATQVQAAATVAPDQLPAAGASRQLSEVAPSAIRELARAGVPVTPQLAQAVSRAVEQLTSPPGAQQASAGGAGAGGSAPPAIASVDTAARSVANLVARGVPITPEGAGRVAAALDLAGKLGTQLGELAKVSPQVAAALPSSTPGASALRALVSSSLSPAELALARIAQAQSAAPAVAASAAKVAASGAGGATSVPTAPASTNPTVVANYVASIVSQASEVADLHPNAAATSVAANAAAQQAEEAHATATPTGAPVGAPANSSPESIRDAAVAVRGQAGAPAALAGQAAGAVGETAGALRPAELVATPAPGTAAAAANAAHEAPVRGAGSAAAAMTNATPAAPTPPGVAQAVAEFSANVSRFATAIAPTEGAPGSAVVAAEHAQSAFANQPVAGTFTPQAAGGAAGGAPAPLITAMRQALTGGGANDMHQLVTAMQHATPEQIAAALRQLPESQTLQLAGKLLELSGQQQAQLPPQQAADLRHAVHNMLQQVGRELQPGVHDEHAALRAALQHVAQSDPRPAVAEQASNLLQASEGSQLLSAPRAGGADAGYVYFQVPMPGNGSAEVVVRREPGRRAVSFDSFDIAFLLNTQSMGTMMIHLDAHPAAMRALVKTDVPALEPLLAAHADVLKAAIEREARRPVIVSTGVFENGEVPNSLLEPQLGIVPGENSYYA